MFNPRAFSLSSDSASGFTLAELLIALAILGVIATFTIPKVLVANQSNQFSAIGKEAAATLAQARQTAQMNGTLNANKTCSDFLPFLNYVSVVTTGTVDSFQSDAATRSCATYTCLKLHNGAIIHFDPSVSFGGTGTLRAIWWGVDPDGKVTGGSNGKSVVFHQYYDGKIRTMNTIEPNTQEVGWTYPSPCADCDPPWFKWN